MSVTPEDVFAWVQRVRDDGPGVWAVVDSLDTDEKRQLVGQLLAYLCALTTTQDAAVAALATRLGTQRPVPAEQQVTALREWLEVAPLGTPGLAGVIRVIDEATAA